MCVHVCPLAQASYVKFKMDVRLHLCVQLRKQAAVETINRSPARPPNAKFSVAMCGLFLCLVAIIPACTVAPRDLAVSATVQDVIAAMQSLNFCADVIRSVMENSVDGKTLQRMDLMSDLNLSAAEVDLVDDMYSRPGSDMLTSSSTNQPRNLSVTHTVPPVEFGPCK